MAEIKIKADSNGGTVSLKGPATTTGDAAIQLTLPQNDGDAGQYLKTDGSGALSWATVSSPVTALNNATANELVTVGSTTTELDGEANLTFSGSQLVVTGTTSSDPLLVKGGTEGNASIRLEGGANSDDNSRIEAKYNLALVANADANIADRGVKIYNGTSTLAEFQADGDLNIVDGNLVIGTAGHGIDFSATANTSASNASMANELLDDYEEGSWEPAAYSGCTGVGHYGSHYVKIGNVCSVWAYIHQVAGANGSEVFKVDGLPFTAHGQDSYPGSCITHGVDNTAGGAMYVNPVIEGNTDRVKLMGSGDTNSWYQLNGSHVGNGDTIMIGITYRTT